MCSRANSSLVKCLAHNLAVLGFNLGYAYSLTKKETCDHKEHTCWKFLHIPKQQRGQHVHSRKYLLIEEPKT